MDRLVEQRELLSRVEKGKLVLVGGWAGQLRKEVKEYEAETEREQRVLDHGWEPWALPEGMRLGNVTRQPLASWIYLYGLAIASVYAGMIAAMTVAFMLAQWKAFGAALAFSLGVIPAFLVLVWMCVSDGRPTRRGDKWVDKSWHQPGEWPPLIRNIEVAFSGAMPKTAYEKWMQDRQLFDAVYVASSDPDVFKVRQVKFADPFLVGRIGNQFYLGAQWDMAKEIARN